jgi:hypothetical protein
MFKHKPPVFRDDDTVSYPSEWFGHSSLHNRKTGNLCSVSDSQTESDKEMN